LEDARALRVGYAFLDAPEVSPESARVRTVAPLRSCLFALPIPFWYQITSLGQVAIAIRSVGNEPQELEIFLADTTKASANDPLL
jgi:hypothetical protein